jgi:tetratricopeptide (TPR) repeat protein
MRNIVATSVVLFVVAGATATAGVLDECRGSVWPAIQWQACGEIVVSPDFGPNEKALAYNILGEARTEAGALDQAIADFTASIRLTSGNMPAFAGRAQARFTAGDFSGSIADYSDAIRISPASVDLHIERGHVYLAIGNIAASIRDLTEAIRLNPSSANAWNNRGLAYRKKGDVADALQDYSTAIAINPVYALAYANRGYLYESQGRKNNAIADLQQSLWLDPSQTDVRAALRRVGAEDEAASESERRVRHGKGLAEANCSNCHAVGIADASPNRNAPEFRNLYRRHRLLALRDPITRGIAAPHDQMPQFMLSDEDVDTIVAYINSLVVTK